MAHAGDPRRAEVLQARDTFRDYLEEYKASAGCTRPDNMAIKRMNQEGILVRRSDIIGLGPSPGIPVNEQFRYRCEMSACGVHTPTQDGIAVYKDRTRQPAVELATSVVSGGGYENRDQGGLLEAVLGTDSLILVGQGKGDQQWSERRNAAMVESMAREEEIRVVRSMRHDAGGHGFVYCGTYQVVDRWMAQVAWMPGPRSAQAGQPQHRRCCMFKMERMPGQVALKDCEMVVSSVGDVPGSSSRRDQVFVSRCALKGIKIRYTGSAWWGDIEFIPQQNQYCGCCALDINGRTDAYECNWCVRRVAETPSCPLACPQWTRGQRSSGGASSSCLHTWPAYLCTECIDVDELPLAHSDHSEWACELCAAKFALWGNTPPARRNSRGAWVLTPAAAAAPPAAVGAAAPAPALKRRPEPRGEAAEPAAVRRCLSPSPSSILATAPQSVVDDKDCIEIAPSDDAESDDASPAQRGRAAWPARRAAPKMPAAKQAKTPQALSSAQPAQAPPPTPAAQQAGAALAGPALQQQAQAAPVALRKAQRAAALRMLGELRKPLLDELEYAVTARFHETFYSLAHAERVELHQQLMERLAHQEVASAAALVQFYVDENG